MPTFSEHYNNSIDNLSFLDSLDNNPNYKWKVTTVYYVALHVLNSFLAAHNNHPTTHNETKAALNKAGLPNNIYDSYIKLENLSRRARYHSNKTFSEINFITSLTYLNEIIDFYRGIYNTQVFNRIGITLNVQINMKYFYNK